MFGSLTKQMLANGLLESQIQFYYKGFNVTVLAEAVDTFVAPKWRTSVSCNHSPDLDHRCPYSWFFTFLGLDDTVEGLNLRQFLVD